MFGGLSPGYPTIDELRAREDEVQRRGRLLTKPAMQQLWGGPAFIDQYGPGATPEQLKKAATDIAFGGIVAGPGAKTADLAKLALAKKLAKQGKSPGLIEKLTGWWKGTEGKWKFEISDDLARARQSRMGGKTPAPTTLDEALKHDRLYEAYPDLKNIKVEVGRLGKGTTGELNAGLEMRLNRDMWSVPGSKQPKATMLHETQHAIQQKEGFAPGGYPKPGYLKPTRPPAPKDIWNDQIEKLTEKVWDLENRLNNATSLSQKQMLTKRLELASTDLRAAENFEYYKRLAGEVEARTVEKRMGMNVGQRKAVPYHSDQVVSPNQQIISTEGGPVVGLLGRRRQ